jgi:uncharacterized repeat protein (TIGR01451 family)
MRQRHYGTSVGRFLSVDPLRLKGGELNWYTYAANNPLNFVDPQGLMIVFDLEELLSHGTGMPGGSEGSVRQWLESLYEKAEALDTLTNPLNWLEGRDPCVGWLNHCESKTTEEVGPSRVQQLARQHDLELSAQPEWYAALKLWDPEVLLIHLKLLLGLIDVLVAAPRDPNEKAGPAGVGPQHGVAADDDLRYTIYFENVITATAPAQQVVVADALDPDLDWTTFRPTEIAFGDTVLAFSAQTGAYTTRLTIPDYRPEVTKTWQLDITAQIDYQTGQATWLFRTLDPQTGKLPDDALAGFLPPNNTSGRGEGHVSFSIRPKPHLARGTLITNWATIVFDEEASIATNEVRNTIGEANLIYLPVILRNR